MPNRNQQDTVYLQSGSPETEARPASGQYGAGITQADAYLGQLGQLLTVQDPTDSKKSKQYRLVQNDSVMDVLPAEGAVAWWKDRQKYLVTTDFSVAGRGNIAGIYRRVSALNDLVCIQRRGDGTVLAEDTLTTAATAAGLITIPGDVDGRADVLAAGSAATYPKLGVTISTEDTDGLFRAALAVEDGMAEG